MTLTAAWAAHWRAAPDHVVLVDGATGSTLTAAALDAVTGDRAGRLAGAGVQPGDRVLLSCAPSIDTVLAYVAILRLGAVVVPANTDYTAAELDHIVATVRPVTAVIDDAARLPGALALGAHRPGELGDLPGGSTRLDVATADDAAMIAFTSGTTGRPKGAVLTHGNLLAGAQSIVTAWEWRPGDRLLHALPMFHMHGLGAGLNGTLTAGASLVVVPRFSVDSVVDLAAAHGVTMFFGVPTMYTRLLESGRLRELRGLRLLVSGSAPLDPVLFAAIAAQAGQSPVERYGMSETVMLVSNPVHGERRAGSVGLALPGVGVRLGEGDVVEVNGPNVFSGYWERPDATADAFTSDGWFRTGDIGEFDDDGYLRLVGRASDLIITGGYNVYPREVEDAIREHPGVADVAVVGIPDATWGETVAAFVVASGPVDVAELEARAAERLAPYKRPRVWNVVPALPRNAMGKVRRDVLREQGMMAP